MEGIERGRGRGYRNGRVKGMEREGWRGQRGRFGEDGEVEGI